MSLDSVLCARIDCVFNRHLEKEWPCGSHILTMTPICGVRGKPDLDKNGTCVEFVKIIDSDNFGEFYGWVGEVYSANRHEQLQLSHKECLHCYRHRRRAEAIIENEGTRLESAWCPSCYANKSLHRTSR